MLVRILIEHRILLHYQLPMLISRKRVKVEAYQEIDNYYVDLFRFVWYIL